MNSTQTGKITKLCAGSIRSHNQKLTKLGIQFKNSGMKQTNLVDLSSNLYDALNQLPPNSVALNKTVLPYFLYKKTPRLLHEVLNGRECVD